MSEEHSAAPQPAAPPLEAGRPAVAPVGRAVALLGSSNVLAFVAGVMRQKVFAVFLGPAGVGALSLAVSLFDTLVNTARLGVPTGLLREGSRALAEDQPHRADRSYRMSRTLLLGVSGSVFIAVLLGRHWVSETVFQGALPPWVAPFVASAVPLLLLGSLSETMMTAYGSLARLASSKVVTTLASLAVMVPLVIWLGFTGALLQIWTGAALAALIAAVACRRVFVSDRDRARSVPKPVAQAAFKALLLIGLAEAIYHVAVMANLFAFRVLVVQELGIEAAGLYQVPLALSRQWVPAVLGGVFVALYPRLGALVGQERAAGAEVRNALELVFVLGVPAALVILSTRDWIITLLLAESFREAEPLLRLSAPGDLAALMAGILHISLLALGAARGFLLAGLGLEVLYLFLVWTSLGPLGLTGPVVAYAVVSLLAVVVYLVILQRVVRGRFTWPARLRFLLGSVAVLGAAGLPGPGGPARWAILAFAIGWSWVHLPRIRREFKP